MAAKLPDGPAKTGFEDIFLIHQALPELDWNEVDISTEIFGKRLSCPLVINAMTGGAEESLPVNRAIARIARKAKIGMAVGSQKSALEEKNFRETFAVVREENPEGLIFANLNSSISIDEAREAVAMIEADALQVHLNVPQELYMAEGDRNFRGLMENLEKLCSELEVPVIVKEVGFGISGEITRALCAKGIKNIDIGGQGGTNFIAIEQFRQEGKTSPMETWGLTTVCSLVEVSSQQVPGLLIASGGIRTSLDAAKSLALGAQAVGVAGPILKLLHQKGETEVISCLEAAKEDLRRIMLMTGARNIKGLQKVPLVFTGFTREWLQERGYNTTQYAQRGC